MVNLNKSLTLWLSLQSKLSTMHQLFSYGTLQDPKIQITLFGKLLFGSPDRLQGYEKQTIVLEGTTYPVLVDSSDKTTKPIDGICYTVTDQELKACDFYEGSAYRRVKTVLDSGKEAWVYLGV